MNKRKKILAVASKGGHWIQLLKIKEAWSGCNVVYLSNDVNLKYYIPNDNLIVVRDANIDSKINLLIMALQIIYYVLKIRPEIVISTGAAPGYISLVVGKITGAKTIWIDSIANGEELSLSGKKVKKFADVWLTQWEDLSKKEGPKYWGGIF